MIFRIYSEEVFFSIKMKYVEPLISFQTFFVQAFKIVVDP